MVPVSLFQFLFALVNPMQAALKFQKLARLDPDGPAARLFVALEDWLADGVPMPVGAAKDLLLGWQIENATGDRRLALPRADGRPGRVTAPALLFCGASDSIAPPPLALPLGRRPAAGGGRDGPHRPRGDDRRQRRARRGLAAAGSVSRARMAGERWRQSILG